MRGAATRQERSIGVEHGAIAAIPERAERGSFGIGGIREQGERRIGVGREDDAIVPPLGTVDRHGDVAIEPTHGDHRRRELEREPAGAQPREQRVDVAAAATGDRAPRERP